MISGYTKLSDLLKYFDCFDQYVTSQKKTDTTSKIVMCPSYVLQYITQANEIVN